MVLLALAAAWLLLAAFMHAQDDFDRSNHRARPTDRVRPGARRGGAPGTVEIPLVVAARRPLAVAFVWMATGHPLFFGFGFI